MPRRAKQKPLPQKRGYRLDTVALGLFLMGLIVGVCVLSQERTGAESENLLGPGGSWIADRLFAMLGYSVYVLLTSWFVLALLLFMRKSWQTWTLRLTGWLLLLPCAAILADLFGPAWIDEPLPGGALGSLLTGSLDDLIPMPFTPVFIVSCIFLGLFLSAKAALSGTYQIARVTIVGTAGFIGGLLRRPPKVIEVEAATEEESQPARSKKLPKVDDIPIVRSVAKEPLVEKEPDVPAALVHTIARAPQEPMEVEQSYEGYELPPLTLLEDPAPFPFEEHDELLRQRAILLEKTFKDFDLNIKVVGINTGPVITQYEVALETGLRLSKVTVLADDLALNLKVSSVRIVAPIPGKNTVGIEIPNEHRATVRIKEVLLTSGRKVAKSKLPLFLGKDTEGRPLVYDLAEMPHLLIAGRTGTGKSVCLNAIILSLLMTRRPDEVKMIMIDPKMTELSEYGKIPHLMHPVVKDMKKAEAILSWAVDKMEERYELLSRARVRGIAGYNELGLEEIMRRVQPDEEETKRIQAKMPYIVIIVDEVGDLMMMMKREVETHIIRLAQKSRAAGIHLIIATQKPTVDVITGLIKSNLPARICFQVSSRTDSRVVLDEMGADKLLGKGDMLFLQPGTSIIQRAQGTYASDQEITKVVEHLECDEPCFAKELVQLKTTSDPGGLNNLKVRDEFYEQAIDIVIREGRGSVSLLQRSLGIGYGRAARLVDFMAEDGIVGAYNGSNAREVLFTPEQWEETKRGAPVAV